MGESTTYDGGVIPVLYPIKGRTPIDVQDMVKLEEIEPKRQKKMEPCSAVVLNFKERSKPSIIDSTLFR